MDSVRELQRKIPDLEVIGKMQEGQEETKEQMNRPRRHR
jgi:hypothetical protein